MRAWNAIKIQNWHLGAKTKMFLTHMPFTVKFPNELIDISLCLKKWQNVSTNIPKVEKHPRYPDYYNKSFKV